MLGMMYIDGHVMQFVASMLKPLSKSTGLPMVEVMQCDVHVMDKCWAYDGLCCQYDDGIPGPDNLTISKAQRGCVRRLLCVHLIH